MNFQAGMSARQSARDLIFTGLVPVADGAIFIATVGAGMATGVAHIISFAVAGLLNYLLTVRGVISLLMGWGWSAQWAIWPAVALTVVLTRAGQTLCLASGLWSLGSGAHW